MSSGELILITAIDFLKLLSAVTENVIQFMRKVTSFTRFLQGACLLHYFTKEFSNFLLLLE
jgi:hypothetical protein